MKALPIVFIKPNNTHDIMLHENLRREAQKLNKTIFISTPKVKQEPINLISEEENEKILEKLKQINKEIFGI